MYLSDDDRDPGPFRDVFWNQLRRELQRLEHAECRCVPIPPIPMTSPAESRAEDQPKPRILDATLDRHKERHGWSRLLFEMVLLVASVLLAFAVNDWSNGRDRQKLELRVLQDLKHEISVNQAAIQASVDYHDNMAHSLHKARDQVGAGGTFEYPPDFDGLREIVFQRAAYDSALLSQTLPHLSVEALAAVSALYTEQDEYTQSLRLYSAATIQSDNKDAMRDLRLAETCLKQMARDERQLLPLMASAQTAIDKELAAQ